MLSFGEWMRLRQIERELGESDPELERVFQTEGPRAEWYQHRGLRTTLTTTALVLIILGVLAANVLAIVFGFLVWSVSVCLIMVNRPRQPHG